MKLLDLNPVEICTSGSPGIPGISSLVQGKWVSGSEALRNCRVDPQSTVFDVWKELDVEEVHPSAGMRHRADLAVAQLKALGVEPGESFCAAVPSTWTTEQLQVFLGVAQETGLKVSALFPRSLAVAKSAQMNPGPVTVLEWDWTELRILQVDAENGDWHLSGSQVIPELGVLGCFRRESRFVAARMLEKNRVDPLHSGAKEQELFADWWAWHRGETESWRFRIGCKEVLLSIDAEELRRTHDTVWDKAELDGPSALMAPPMLKHLLGQTTIQSEPTSLVSAMEDLTLPETTGARWMETLSPGASVSSPDLPVTHVVFDGVAEPAPAGITASIGETVILPDGRTALAIHVPKS